MNGSPLRARERGQGSGHSRQVVCALLLARSRVPTAYCLSLLEKMARLARFWERTMKKRLAGISVAATLAVLTLSSIGLAKKGEDPADGLSYQLTVTSVELPLPGNATAGSSPT